MSQLVYNVPDFALEEAYFSYIVGVTGISALLNLNLGTQVFLGMGVANLTESHVAFIVANAQPHEEMKRSGNFTIEMHVKVVTALNEVPTAPLTTLRQQHLQRVGAIRDALYNPVISAAGTSLDQALSAQSPLASGQTISVIGFEFGAWSHRVEDTSWVSEIIIMHPIVCGAAITGA